MVPAVRWSGKHALASAVGVGVEVRDEAVAQLLARGRRRDPARQRGPRWRAGPVLEASRARLEGSLGRVGCRRRRRRAGRAGRRRTPPRTARPGATESSRKPSGSSRSAAVGSRCGDIHTPSRASVPCRVRSEPHRVEASRSRRGRSSRPTRVAKVCSAGPPAARRRRTVSCSLAAAGIRSAVAWPTTSSTQPSTSARVTSSFSSAAFWAGDGSGSNSPPAIASCIAAGLVRSMSRSFSSMPEVSKSMPAPYSATAPMRWSRSHGTSAKSRWWAASRSAR